jgi:hypothetical protein
MPVKRSGLGVLVLTTESTPKADHCIEGLWILRPKRPAAQIQGVLKLHASLQIQTELDVRLPNSRSNVGLHLRLPFKLTLDPGRRPVQYRAYLQVGIGTGAGRHLVAGAGLCQEIVGQCPDELPQAGLARRLRIGIGDARDPEIQNLGLARLIDQNIARLQVAMNHSALMRMFDGIADFSHHCQALASVELAPLRVLQQRAAADELHGETGLGPEAGIGGTCFVDLGKPWVLQTAQRLDSS